MADLAGGAISLLIAAVFLAILAYAVPSVPLWIVILIGFALMVASFIETWRSDQPR
jgi:chromate transport protein ChrA